SPAPPEVGAPQPENATALPAARVESPARASTPSLSARLPSGRLRPSEPVIGPAEGGTRWTGYGEGWGEGNIHKRKLAETPPAPARKSAPTSPRLRGEVAHGANLAGMRSRSRLNGRERSAGAKPARPQPGRRRSPAVNAGTIREGHSGSSRRPPGPTNP